MSCFSHFILGHGHFSMLLQRQRARFITGTATGHVVLEQPISRTKTEKQGKDMVGHHHSSEDHTPLMEYGAHS